MISATDCALRSSHSGGVRSVQRRRPAVEIFAVITDDAEKRVVRFENPAIEIADEDADDVGVDQAPDLRLAFARDRGTSGCSQAIAACEASSFSTEIRAGVKIRGARLFSRYSTPMSLVWLTKAGKERTGPGAAGCTDPGKSGVSRGIVENQGLARAQDGLDDGLRQRNRRQGLVAQLHGDRAPQIVASAASRCSLPATSTNTPRSAPACSIAVRMSVSSNLSSTISPDTACDTLSTVARSSCSTDAWMVFVGPSRGGSSSARDKAG